jgi:hypothetical protein
MVASQSDIQELRTRLERSRWQLHDGIHQLESQLNGTPRLANSSHRSSSMRWMAVTMAAGLALVKMMPWLVHGTRQPWFRRLFPAVSRAALLIGLSTMAQKRRRFLKYS